MPMVSHSIKNLLNGVSQQPPSIRLASQGELQENAYPTLLDGNGKRPNTKHLAKILTAAQMNPQEKLHVHFINRDASEQYVVLLGNQTLKVFSLLTGEEIPVSAPGGLAYLTAETPRSAFQCVTVADHTFILNKTKTVAKLAGTSPAQPHEALVWIKSGLYSTRYRIWLTTTSPQTGFTAEYTTPDSTGDSTKWSTEYIAEQLKTKITEKSSIMAYTVDVSGSLLRIRRTDGGAFFISVLDSYGDQAMRAFKGTVQKYQDLPARALNNFKVKVENDPETRRDNFYLTYSLVGNTTGVWSETYGWSLQNKLDPATMPHKLVRQANGTFSFEPCPWAERQVGDEDTAPTPSFVGKTLADIFYFRNRLGVLSDENVIYSAAGDYYCFWPETAMQTLDSDPIDVSVGSDKVSVLRHAVPLMERLLIFADQVQFSQSSSAVLSPEDIQIDQTTTYDYSPLAKPVASGSSIFFSTKRGQYTGIMEYLIDPDTKVNQAIDMTAHVPEYIPSNVFQLVAGVNINLLLCLTLDERNAVYAYNYWWEGTEKVQSCWGKWVFGVDDIIVGLGIIDSTAYFVIKRPDGLFLESMELMTSTSDPGLGYRVFLDRRVYVKGVFNPDTNITTWTLPYKVPVTSPVVVVRGPSFSGNGIAVSTFRGDLGTETQVFAYGNHTAGECYVGVPYTWKYRLSEQFLKEDEEDRVSIISGRLQLHQMTVRYANTVYFKVLVTPTSRDTFTYTNDVHVDEAVIGPPVPVNGSFSFPVMARSDRVTVEFQNDSHYPCYIQSIDWKGRYTAKASRR